MFRTQASVERDQALAQAALERGITQVLRAAASGDFAVRVPLHGLPPQLQATGEAANQLLDQLQGLYADIRRVQSEHARGDIDVQLDSSRGDGQWRDLAQSVNELVGSHIAVKKQAMAVVRQFGEGNFDAPLEQLPGKKAFINDTIEQVRSNLRGLIAQINHMSSEHDKGDIDVVIDASRFQGDFGTMAAGINRMVGAHIAVKKRAMEVVGEFGRGNFDAPMEALPGKKAFINTVIEQVRGNLRGLIAQMNHMSAEHNKGDIDVVIDASRFQGDFCNMAEGINGMVGAHIAVKKRAMEVIGEFGRGNFDAPMEVLPGKKAFINHTIEQMRCQPQGADPGHRPPGPGRAWRRAAGACRCHRSPGRLPPHRGGLQPDAGCHRGPAARGAAHAATDGSRRPDPNHGWPVPRRLRGAAKQRQQHAAEAGRDAERCVHRGPGAHRRFRPGVVHFAVAVAVRVVAGRQRGADHCVAAGDGRFGKAERRQRQPHRRHGHQGRQGSGGRRPGRDADGGCDEVHRHQDLHHRRHRLPDQPAGTERGH